MQCTGLATSTSTRMASSRDRAPFVVKISGQNPFRPPLDEFIEHHAHVTEHKPADIKPEELGRMSHAQLEADVRLRGMPQSRIFHLTGDLICGEPSTSHARGEAQVTWTYRELEQHRTASPARPCNSSSDRCIEPDRHLSSRISGLISLSSVKSPSSGLLSTHPGK